MELTLHKPDSTYFIRSAGEEGIMVVDRLLSGPLLMSATRMVENWPPGMVADVTPEHLQAIFEFSAEVVLIGTGKQQAFLPPAMAALFYEQGMGLEVMTTPAACRTFNVLISEGRDVVAALMPMTPMPTTQVPKD